MAKEDLQEHLPYQQASLVRQTLAELAQARTLGQTTRVQACEKVLDGLGWKPPEADKPAPEVRRDTPPQGRHTAERSTVAAKGGVRPSPRKTT